MNRTIAIFSVAAAVTSTVITASASTFEISGSGNSFSVTRSGEVTNTAETVYYRAVGLTAYAGQHFIIPSGASPAASVALAFGAGETNRLISVEERTPSATAYKFQTGTSRAYRLEVVDEGGFLLASCDRVMTVGTSIPDPPSAAVSGMFAEKRLTIKSDETTASDAGYINNPYLSMAGSAYYDSAAPKAWFQQIGAQLRMTLSMQVKEVNDGYQYIQLLFDNTSSCDDRSDCKDGNPGNINRSRYMAGFGHHPGSYDGNYATYTFPVLSAGNNCGNIDNPWNNSISAKLYDQKFRYAEYRGSDGKLIIPTAFNTLVLRLNASGDNQDNWTCKNVEARIQAFDTTAPTLIGVAVSPGPYHRGNPVAISLAFSEAVNPFFNQFGKLETTWGSLSKPDINYLSGKGGNVLTFTGKISDAKADGTALAITGFDNNTAVRDFARNEFVKSAVSSWSLSGYTIAPTTKNYSIAYDLAGGALPEGASNPATYNYDTPRFVLVNPVDRPGYIFTGWTDTDISSAKTNVVVYHAHGDRAYRAVWTPIAYPIAYDGATNGVAGVSNANPTSYTVEDDTITLAAPTRTGYTFDGWFADAARTVRAQTEFSATDMEPKTFYAAWTPITYTVRFDANGGSGDMPDQTMTYDATQALAANAFAYPGYAFAGWTGPGSAAYADGANVSNLSAEQGAVVTLSATWNNTDWANEGRSGDTEEDAYLIYTPWQLDLLATRVNAGNGYMGKRFRLMADIAYDANIENNFTPIGSTYMKNTPTGATIVELPFSGTFDGNGHTVSGIRVSGNDGYFKGLFGALNFGCVKNLTLADAVLVAGPQVIAGGIVCSFGRGEVKNCFVTGTTINAAYCGGAIVGCDRVTGGNFDGNNAYHNCTVNANVADVGIGGDNIATKRPHDISGGAEACYAIDASSGAVVASEADFAFPVFGVTNRYWKAGSSVRLEYAGTLAAGQLTVFSVNGEQFAGDVFEMPATNATVSVDVTNGHSWNAPVYAWADDYSAVTASVVCADCGATWLQVFAATPVVSRAATCNETGEMTWTAEVPENVFGFTTQTVVESGLPAALGHEWVSTNWTWSADYSEATLSLACGRDHAHDAVVPAVITLDGETRDVFTWKATAECEGETFSDVEFQVREKYTVTVGDSDGGKLTVCFATSDGRLIQLDDIGLAPRYRGKSPAGEWVYLVPESDILVAVSMSVSGESIPLLWDPKLGQSYFIMPAHEVTVSAVLRPCRSINVDYGCFGVTGCVVRVNSVALGEDDSWSAPLGWPVEIEFMVKDGWTGGSVIVQGDSDIFAGTNFCCAATGKGAGIFAATFAMPDYSIEARCCAVPSVSFQLGTNTVHLVESNSSEYRAYTPDESGWYRFRLFAEEDSSHRLCLYDEDGSDMDHFGGWSDDDQIYTAFVRLEAGETYIFECNPYGSPNSKGENDLVVIDKCPALALNEDIGICIDSVHVDGEELLLGYDDIGIPVGAEVQVKYSLADTNILQGVEVKTASGDDVLFTREDSGSGSDCYFSVSFAMPDEAVAVTPVSEMDAELRLVLGRNDVPFYGGMPDYRFAPEESGWYRFRSDSAAAEKGEIDPRVGIYKANGDYVAYGDDISYDPETEMYNRNFCCKAFLVGGKVYCIDFELYEYTDATNVIPVFVEKTAPHAITVENTGCGRVAVRDGDGDNELLAAAEAGREVRIYAEPMSSDYLLAELTVVDATGDDIALENGYDGDYDYWCFTMPATNVTVSAVFCSRYPKYLDDANDDVLYNYDEWAQEYGYDVYGTKETAFLLNVAPEAITNGVTPLKIVELGTTNVCYQGTELAMLFGDSADCLRVVLASDATELEHGQDIFNQFAICNGYLVLRIGTDLSAPRSEWLESSWFFDSEDGRAVISFPAMLVDSYCDIVKSKTGKPVNGLFLSAAISTRPADMTNLYELIPFDAGEDIGDGGDEGDNGDDGD